MANIGYVRVSTKDQNEARQVRKMQEKGVEERYLFIDKASGKDFNRQEYAAMKRALRPGDQLYIHALDRLGRNYDKVIEEWKDITRNIGADIIVLENEALFDSRKFREMGDMGRLMEDQFLSLLSYVADQERKKIRARQREGIAAAKAEGKHLGRPRLTFDALTEQQRKTWHDVYHRWKQGDVKAVEFMRLLDVKKTSFYKLVKEYESNVGH